MSEVEEQKSEEEKAEDADKSKDKMDEERSEDEMDTEENDRKQDFKYQRKPNVYLHETYGEEFEGEDFYPPPSDLDLLLATTDQETAETPPSDEKLPPDEIDLDAMEEELKSEIMDLGGEEEEDRKSEIHLEKASLPSVSSYDYGPSVTEYFMQPKIKTPSELKFEHDYREIVEEKMKKILGPVDEEKEKKIEERQPVQKKKYLITEFDVKGLYPIPRVIESVVSFAFEEDEEGEKAYRAIQSEADITQFIMEVVRDNLRYDNDSIFAKNNKDAIQKVRTVVEEIVTSVRKGLTLNIANKVNESLSQQKENLRNVLILRLKERLEKAERAVDKEEEEEEETKGKIHKSKKGKVRKAKKKAKESIPKIPEEQFPEEPEITGEEEETATEIDMAYETVAKEKEKEKEVTLIAKFKIKEEEERMEEEEEEKAEEGSLIPYEKIDWQQYLTESEKLLTIDSGMRLEMDEFIRQRKAELEKESKVVEEKKAKKSLYKKIKDKHDLLKMLGLYVTMKFILNTGETFTSAYGYFMKFKEIKEELSKIFRVPSDVFIIYRNDVEIRDEQTTFDLTPDVEPFECVTFRLVTLDNDQWPLKSHHLDLPIPDIITCTIETGKDHTGVIECKDVVVEIEDRRIKKPFVGGYRDCCTGIEYHHAFSQSGPHPPKLPWDRRVSKDTQTSYTNTKLINTMSDKATQMARRDYFVSTETDKIITPKRYVNYQKWYKAKDIEGKVRTIQKYVRAMIIRRFLKQKSEEYKKRHCWEVEQEKKRTLERENRIKLNIINMTYPRTKADFEMLYALVEKWRKAQVERICKLKTEAPRKAELCSVLEKEIKLLEAIEVHRIAASEEQKRIRQINFMERVAKPISWTGYRGMTIKMDTIKTQRARELKELYQSLTRRDLEYQDRIELLISIKYALRIHKSKITDELTNLIDQESELMIRGTKPKNLEYLRKRTEHLFLEYFKDPYFNPEVAKYDPMFNREPLKNNILFCKLCHQMKLVKNFSATTRDVSINVCSGCQWIYNIAVARVDLAPFRFILKTVRRDEQKRNCYSSCAFILQDEDMRFLVQNIWRSRSAVSEYDNLGDLRMPRWDKSKDWTPWNCILLTELETKAHLKTRPEDNYEPQLIGEIVSKHEMAKRHFTRLFSTTATFQDSGKWANTVDVKEYKAPPILADLWDIQPNECLKLKKGALYEVHETRRKDDHVQYM